MMLANPLLGEAITFSENTINTIVLENAVMFRNSVTGITEQANGGCGDFVVSENFEPLDFGKTVEMITDVFSLDFSAKRFSAKINQQAIAASADYDSLTAEIFEKLNALAGEIITSVNYEITYSSPEDISGIIKVLNFSIDSESLNLPEKLFEYIKLCRDFFGKKLFVVVNIKSCLSSEELILFCKSICYEKFDVLFLESFQRDFADEHEKVRIIDADLCEI